MECKISVYDETLTRIGLITEFISFVYEEQYTECGRAQLVIAKSDFSAQLLQPGRFLGIPGGKTLAVIVSVEDKEQNGSRELWIYATEAKILLNERVYAGKLSGENQQIESVLRDALSASRLPDIISVGNSAGLTATTNTDYTYPALGELCSTLCAEADYGYRLRFDKPTKKFIFELYEGKTATHIKFSERYGNLADLYRAISEENYKNIAYVGGEEREGVERIYVVAGDDTLAGLERREMYVDASDIKQESLSEADYKALLVERGNEELAKCIKTDCVEFSVAPDDFGVDYELGDKITCVLPEYGIILKVRVIGVTWTWENNKNTIALSLGTPIVVRRK